MTKNKSLQIHSKTRLDRDKELSKDDIAQFIHEFQSLHSGQEGKRKLISLRVPQVLLDNFKMKAKIQKISYQTLIVDLMRQWLKG